MQLLLVWTLFVVLGLITTEGAAKETGTKASVQAAKSGATKLLSIKTIRKAFSPTDIAQCGIEMAGEI